MLFKDKLRQLCCFLDIKHEKYKELIRGFMVLIILINFSGHIVDYSFSNIITIIFMIFVMLIFFSSGILKIKNKPFVVSARMFMIGANFFSIIVVLVYMFSLNTLATMFKFNSNDILVIFQITGFVLLIPMITRHFTSGIANYFYFENFDPNLKYDNVKEWIRIYAISLIIISYVFQTEAFQYFLY